MKEEKEIKLLFNQLVERKSYTELDGRDIKGLLKLFATMMDKISERKQ